MNAYKVEYNSDKVTHVSATSREEAVYAAFNNVTDLGQEVQDFGDVHIWDDEHDLWIKTYNHRAVSAVVR